MSPLFANRVIPVEGESILAEKRGSCQGACGGRGGSVGSDYREWRGGRPDQPLETSNQPAARIENITYAMPLAKKGKGDWGGPSSTQGDREVGGIIERS